MNFIKFIRSVRHFKEQDVETEKLSKIIEAGRFTQTGINKPDVSYVVVKDSLEELKALALESLKNMGEHLLANLTPETEMYEGYAKMWISMHKAYQAVLKAITYFSMHQQ